jgi:hypothetical protein
MTKSVPTAKLPKTATSVSCRSCKEVFIFDPEVETEKVITNLHGIKEVVKFKKERKISNETSEIEKPIEEVGVLGICIKFAVYYLLLSVAIGVVVGLIGLQSRHGSSSGALLGATLICCNRFWTVNGRYFTKNEKRKVLIGLSLANLAIQLGFTLLLLKVIAIPFSAKLITVIVIVAGVIQPVGIYFIIRMTGTRLMKNELKRAA